MAEEQRPEEVSEAAPAEQSLPEDVLQQEYCGLPPVMVMQTYEQLIPGFTKNF